MKPGKIQGLHDEDDLPDRTGWGDEPRLSCPQCGDLLSARQKICPFCYAVVSGQEDEHSRSKGPRVLGVSTGEVLMVLSLVAFETWLAKRSLGLAGMAFLGFMPWLAVMRVMRLRAFAAGRIDGSATSAREQPQLWVIIAGMCVPAFAAVAIVTLDESPEHIALSILFGVMCLSGSVVVAILDRLLP